MEVLPVPEPRLWGTLSGYPERVCEGVLVGAMEPGECGVEMEG